MDFSGQDIRIPFTIVFKRRATTNARSTITAATLLTVALFPAWGQTAVPGTGLAAAGAQSVSTIPKLSGTWSHPYIPSFEPPQSGPGPVTNKARVRQIVDGDGRPLPRTNNILVSNPSLLVGDYTNPILKPEAAEILKRRGEASFGSGLSDPI